MSVAPLGLPDFEEPLAVERQYAPPTARVDADRSRGWFRRLYPLLASHKAMIATMIGAALAGSVAGVGIPWIVGKALDNALIDGAVSLTPYLWALAGLAVTTVGFGYMNTYFMRKVVQVLEYDMRTLIYRKLSELSFSFYDRAQTGQLISRANSDIRAILMFLGFAPQAAVVGLVFFLALGIMISINPLLALVAVVTLPGVFFVGMRMRTSLFPISWLVQARMADVATIVEENVTGVRIVKSFAAERNQIGLLARAAERLRWSAVKQVDIRARYGPLMENLPRLGRALVLVYGGWLVIQGSITVGTLVIFNQYILRLQAPFRMLGFLMIMGQRAAASALRIFEILDEDAEIEDRLDGRLLESPVGEVEFRGVRFGYREDEPILSGLDLRIRPGETIAIVGRTGCGKSTLARLLPRFYDVNEGQVLVDGVDVREYRVKSLRSHIGLVLDEPFLFSESIRDNIAYGRPDASFDEIEAAAKSAGAHGFIEALPKGYDTIVGERGYTLSGGQRQRVAIARTLLVNPKILVLDDATSAIDVKLEQEIHSALKALLGGRTTLIVAHRLSTIRLADRVVLLDGGRVAADGTHEELMEEVKEYAEILARAEEEQRDALAKAAVKSSARGQDLEAADKGPDAVGPFRLPGLDFGEST